VYGVFKSLADKARRGAKSGDLKERAEEWDRELAEAHRAAAEQMEAEAMLAKQQLGVEDEGSDQQEGREGAAAAAAAEAVGGTDGVNSRARGALTLGGTGEGGPTQRGTGDDEDDGCDDNDEHHQGDEDDDEQIPLMTCDAADDGEEEQVAVGLVAGMAGLHLQGGNLQQLPQRGSLSGSAAVTSRRAAGRNRQATGTAKQLRGRGKVIKQEEPGESTSEQEEEEGQKEVVGSRGGRRTTRGSRGSVAAAAQTAGDVSIAGREGHRQDDQQRVKVKVEDEEGTSSGGSEQGDSEDLEDSVSEDDEMQEPAVRGQGGRAYERTRLRRLSTAAAVRGDGGAGLDKGGIVKGQVEDDLEDSDADVEGEMQQDGSDGDEEAGSDGGDSSGVEGVDQGLEDVSEMEADEEEDSDYED
jgi:hypothetical protein